MTAHLGNERNPKRSSSSGAPGARGDSDDRVDSANKLTLERNVSTPNTNGNAEHLGDLQYTFDQNGNLTKKAVVGDGNTFYLYDYENHMTKLNDGVVLTFTYNGDGGRFSKYDGTNTTKFVYDRRTGTPGLDPVLIETDNSGTTTATYTNEGGAISQKRGSTTNWYNFEAIGTTRQLTDSSQVVSDTYSFDAWGNGLSSSGSTANSLKYVGKQNYYTDAQSGLMMLGVRYYDANVGRFTSADPARDGIHWCVYVSNRPTEFIDQSGMAGDRDQCQSYLSSAASQIFEAIHRCILGLDIHGQCNSANNSLSQFEQRGCGRFDDLARLHWWLQQMSIPVCGNPGCHDQHPHCPFPYKPKNLPDWITGKHHWPEVEKEVPVQSTYIPVPIWRPHPLPIFAGIIMRLCRYLPVP